MKLFGKKKDVNAVPQEVREYYEAERRERTGMAWLLAIGTLVVTLLLASGLFFGGRWVYRTVFDNKDDKKQPVATETKKDESKKTDTNKPNETTGSSSGGTTTPQAARTDTPSTSTPRPTTPTQGPATTTLPSSGTTTLANTGPTEVIIVFAAVVTAGTLYHRFVLTPLKKK